MPVIGECVIRFAGKHGWKEIRSRSASWQRFGQSHIVTIKHRKTKGKPRSSPMKKKVWTKFMHGCVSVMNQIRIIGSNQGTVQDMNNKMTDAFACCVSQGIDFILGLIALYHLQKFVFDGFFHQRIRLFDLMNQFLYFFNGIFLEIDSG